MNSVVLGAEGAYEARCRYCYDPSEAQQERLEIGTEAGKV
jgi:thymidine kinase